MSARGIVIAAAASGSGKTTLTLGLLRALRNRGVRVRAAKVGPDFIDPAFHAAACGAASVTLDGWAMRDTTLRCELASVACDAEIVIVEGVMGLFDGARDGSGSTAQVAQRLGLPVLLVLDVAAQAATAAAVAFGLARYRPEISVAGAILNRVGSPGHAAMIAPAVEELGIRVLGALPSDALLSLPSRHLGLVQAREHPALEAFIEAAAAACAARIDLDALIALAAPIAVEGVTNEAALLPLGKHIAVADDLAFAFSYPHVLEGWRRQGAQLSSFSPLADEAPAPEADAVYLCGGYPELHAARLSAAGNFRRGMLAARARGAAIYGECGGYMVLGDSICDAQGVEHEMLGFLPLRSSFAAPRMHLGYREVRPLHDAPFARAQTPLRGQEFHFATGREEAGAEPLFQVLADDGGRTPSGLRRENVSGSFVHLIDRR
ncbi:MAG TPA: cobyrinate a,c-diamide synthase [Candidatus Dormibacteraeota bacterium]|nr:cobyrinate a,c-diamide synthase [Candidatus Dormibacteraeota bacterium]